VYKHYGYEFCDDCLAGFGLCGACGHTERIVDGLCATCLEREADYVLTAQAEAPRQQSGPD
jgi:hypothetical protein